MRVGALRVTFFLATILLFQTPSSAEKSDLQGGLSFLLPRQFSWESMVEPESIFWPGYFWYWNGPLEPEVLRRQLSDMAAHDARSVCVVPEPPEFRPTTMNTLMDAEYLSPRFFDRVKIAVDEAARLKMNYWLYDEGGWPSGQAAGRVRRARPDVASRYLALTAQGRWEPKETSPQDRAAVDLLNPAATATFIALTHQRYADAVGKHFGKTIKFCFTDEPAYRAAIPGRTIPWTNGAEQLFQRRFGYDPLSRLDAFGVADPKRLSPAQKKVRAELFDFWSERFRDAYFLPIRDWARGHGLASGGHIDREDETFAAVTAGFGHVMRPLRAMDVPGVDVIWRQLWPGKANHHFAKFAASAAHQNGTALVMTESFGVYGNGLTPAQMKWLVDYQYVRGTTLLVGCKYPLAPRDHLMTDERPNYGPIDPLWDFLPEFHRYVARLSYVLACGRPGIDVALYYPVRDMWANGDPTDPALRGHDLLAESLLAHQCDFDIVDDDVLADPSTRLDGGRLAVGAMRYRTIVVGPTQWMNEAAKKRLEAFQAAGGQVIHATDLDRLDVAVAAVKPTVTLDPPSSGVRATSRRWPGGGATFLFNEGSDAYRGMTSIACQGELNEIDPVLGQTRRVAGATQSAGIATLPLSLAAGESLLLVEGSHVAAEAAAARPNKIVRSIELPDAWTARVDRQYVVGEHEYEVRRREDARFRPITLGRWAGQAGLSADFSGHVTYRRKVMVPESFRGGRAVLDLGEAEYAARVSVDGKPIGCVLWRPWRIELPALKTPGEHVLEIELSNTLANELTSQRVRQAWAKRRGPGWPSPYHPRTLGYEMESRGGGLLGPVRLELVAP
jgi:hypothetical protein